MRGELLVRIFSSVAALLVLEVVLCLGMAGAGIALAALLFPDVLLAQAWLAVAAGAVWGIFAGVGVGFFLPAFRRLREWAPPGTVLYVHSLEEFNRALSLIVDMKALLHNQVVKIQALAGASRVAVLVSTEEGEPYRVRANRGFDDAVLPGVSYQTSGGLARWLYTNETYLVPSENPGVMSFLTPGERGALDRLEIDAVFPLIALNRLLGMILVSGPGGIGTDGIQAVSWFAPQMALALANAILFEQQEVRIRRLYRAERLATVGQLAAGAAHEIRNPLTSIRSTVQYLKKGLEKEPERAELMGDLIEETDRINHILEGLLSFARPVRPLLGTVDLEVVVEQTVRLVEPVARKAGVEIETRFASESPEVKADADQLKQVFLNVMMNAIQAMPNGGTLRITVFQTGTDGGEWRVEVVDTGEGIAREDLEKVFDPFFTTKQDGTGLGLSICHAIVKEHGGEIEVESEQGRGTRVVIRL